MTAYETFFGDLFSAILLIKFTIASFFLRMAESQEKAFKWFQDVQKHKFSKNTSKLERNSESTGKKLDHSPGMNYYDCNYCTKVFVDAKFLVKHILRRHSENLVQLHKKMLEMPNSKNYNLSSPDLINLLRTEFSDLKNELEIVKQTVSQHVYTNTYKVENQDNVKFSDDIRPIQRMGSLQVKGSALLDSIPNNSNESITHVNSADNQYLSSKINELFQLYKKDLVSKEEMDKNLTLRENKIFEELKIDLLSEFQNALLCHENKHKAEWKKHISQLQEEIRRLDEAVIINSQKINSPEISQIVEKRFEQKLQDILHSNLLLNSNKKNINSKSSGHICRKKKSLYTCSQDVEKEKTGKPTHKMHLSLAEKRQERSHCQMYKKCKSLKNDSEGVLELDINAVSTMVDEKLKSLNIDPHIEKLSPSEYENKMADLKNKKEALSSKFVNFSEIRNKMDSYVNKMLKSRGKETCHKKLHFSDSAIDPFHASENKDSNKELPFKKEQTSHSKSMETLNQTPSPQKSCQDYYAQGDRCITESKTIDIQVPSTVKDIEEHPSKFSADESSDHLEGLTCTKEILHSDISNPGTSFRKSKILSDTNIKKKHKDSVADRFDKNIEELSDLSSLSDLEEQNILSN